MVPLTVRLLEHCCLICLAKLRSSGDAPVDKLLIDHYGHGQARRVQAGLPRAQLDRCDVRGSVATEASRRHWVVVSPWHPGPALATCTGHAYYSMILGYRHTLSLPTGCDRWRRAHVWAPSLRAWRR